MILFWQSLQVRWSATLPPYTDLSVEFRLIRFREWPSTRRYLYAVFTFVTTYAYATSNRHGRFWEGTCVWQQTLFCWPFQRWSGQFAPLLSLSMYWRCHRRRIKCDVHAFYRKTTWSLRWYRRPVTYAVCTRSAGRRFSSWRYVLNWHLKWYGLTTGHRCNIDGRFNTVSIMSCVTISNPD